MSTQTAQTPFQRETDNRNALAHGSASSVVALHGEDLASKQRRLRRAVSGDTLASWTKAQRGRSFYDLLLNCGGIVTALWAANAVATWWMYAIAFLVVGCCQHGLFILAHDALHRTLHPNRTLNDALARWLIYGPMFMELEDARRNHLAHHRTIGTEVDPDRYIHTLNNKDTPLKFLLFCSGLATFGKTVLKVTPFGKLLNRTSQVITESTDKVQLPTSARQALVTYVRGRVPVMVAQALLIGAFALSSLPFWAYLVLWVAPIYFCVFLPDEIRAFCDHAVISVPESEADGLRLVTFRPPRLEARILAPHNMNYHAEHHLWPGIPYYNLPKAHQFVKDRPEVTVHGSYLSFLLSVVNSFGHTRK